MLRLKNLDYKFYEDELLKLELMEESENCGINLKKYDRLSSYYAVIL